MCLHHFFLQTELRIVYVWSVNDSTHAKNEWKYAKGNKLDMKHTTTRQHTYIKRKFSQEQNKRLLRGQ